MQGSDFNKPILQAPLARILVVYLKFLLSAEYFIINNSSIYEVERRIQNNHSGRNFKEENNDVKKEKKRKVKAKER
jgi:hypothetical protein